MDPRPLTILIAEDNPGHQRLTEHALRKLPRPCRIFVVRDGQEVLDYLLRRPPYADGDLAPRPDLILLDLNLPKRDGREVLGEIRREPSLGGIPVVVVSTSDRQEDIDVTLGLGARAYVSKSRGFDRFSEEIAAVLSRVPA